MQIGGRTGLPQDSLRSHQLRVWCVRRVRQTRNGFQNKNCCYIPIPFDISAYSL
jgi:hypothetical protein